MADQEPKKEKFDTTKMSAEELKMCATDDAPRRRVVGKAPGMQQAGGVSWRHPMVLAGVAVLTGISTAMYYNSVNHHVQEWVEVGNSNKAVMGDSAPVGDAPADVAAA